MSLRIKIAVAACCIAAVGGKAYADEPTQKVDVNQLYGTNTVCLSENKAYSVGAVVNKLKCDYPSSVFSRPEGSRPPTPPTWQAE